MEKTGFNAFPPLKTQIPLCSEPCLLMVSAVHCLTEPTTTTTHRRTFGPGPALFTRRRRSARRHSDRRFPLPHWAAPAAPCDLTRACGSVHRAAAPCNTLRRGAGTPDRDAHVTPTAQYGSYRIGGTLTNR